MTTTNLTDEQHHTKIQECLDKLVPIVSEVCGDYATAGEVLSLLLGSLASLIDMPQEALIRAVNIAREFFDEQLSVLAWEAEQFRDGNSSVH